MVGGQLNRGQPQPDEWIEGRRYLGLDVGARSLTLIPSPNIEDVNEPLTTAALSA